MNTAYSTTNIFIFKHVIIHLLSVPLEDACSSETDIDLKFPPLIIFALNLRSDLVTLRLFLNDYENFMINIAIGINIRNI
jgi:hypothetical protein